MLIVIVYSVKAKNNGNTHNTQTIEEKCRKRT